MAGGGSCRQMTEMHRDMDSDDLELKLGLNQKSESGMRAESRAYRAQRLRQQREARANGSHKQNSPARILSHHLQSIAKRGTHAINRETLRFLLQKELTQTDLNAAEVVLPKTAAEAYLPCLPDGTSMFITMYDMDYIHAWRFRYRYWYDSRMYVLQKISEFFTLHNLGIGDFIMIYQDHPTQNYVIQARKAMDMNMSSENDKACNAKIELASGLHHVEIGEVKDNGSDRRAKFQLETGPQIRKDCLSKKPLYSDFLDVASRTTGETTAGSSGRSGNLLTGILL